MARLGAFGRAWSPVTPRYFYVAGVALGDIHLRFAWQVCHLVTSTFVLRGRRGTYMHLWHWVGSGGALGRAWARLGTLGRAWSPVTRRYFAWQAWHIHLRFAWQACHLWHWAGSGGALGRAESPGAPRRLAWQAWHLVTSAFVLRGRCGTCGTGLAVWRFVTHHL